MPSAHEACAQTRTTNEFRGNGICRFAVQDYPLTPQMEGTINAGVTKLITLHKSVFGLTNPLPRTVNVRIFGTYEGFKLYHVTHATKLPIWADSFYLPEENEIVASKKSKPAKLLQSIYHEATHAILSKAVGYPPLWFNEGSAEYFSKIMVAQTGIGQEVFREGFGPCKIMLRQNRLPALETVLRYDAGDWPATRQHEVYAVSWSVVQFLTTSQARTEVLRKFVQRLQEYRGNLDSLETLDKLYPGGLKKMEEEWRAWLVSA